MNTGTTNTILWTPRRVPVPGLGDLFSEACGPADGPPVLLVMGAMNPAHFWPPGFVAALVQAGCRVVRYDHRDTGRSFVHPLYAPPYALDALVADALRVLDAWGLARAAVVGWSMGGYIAQHLAHDLERDPHELHNLALDRKRNGELLLAMNRKLDAGIELAAIGRAAHRNQHAVVLRARRHRRALEGRVQAVLLRVHLRHLAAQVHRHAALLQQVGQRLHQVLVGARHQLVHELDHGHFGAQRAVHRRHFQADDAAADHQQALGNIRQFQRAGGVDDALVVVGKARNARDRRACRDNAVFKGDGFHALGGFNAQRMGRGKLAAPGNHLHFTLLGEPR